MGDSTVVGDWLGHFVQSSMREEAVERFVAVVDAAILAALPAVAADAVLVEDLHRSTRHQWLAFLSSLGRADHNLFVPAQASDLARSLARRGMEVRVLLRVYLSAHHGVFAYLSEAIDRLSAEDNLPEEVLRTVWRRADRWMDESVEALIETFYVERERELAGSAARRAELVDEILAAKPIDLAHASTTLGHPLHLHQTAFLVWSGEVDERTASMLQSAAEELARTFDGGTLLTQLSGSRDLRCWVATVSPPPPATMAALAEKRFETVAVAVGRPGPGADGFRVSHLEARSAQRLAMDATSAPPFVDYRDVELLCMAMADLPALKRMVRREVGPICVADKNLAPVRETVLTYLANRMNVEATAERLYVHGNTVRYRLAKAEELLGCQLADRPRHLELALQYVAYFGPPAD
ncbi:PucR family transcriptional regulator [Rhodococcus gannanensis]|uniref:PucR family transcriptional regulator n=1 Tax=Rhodococcus gannanensis TaxID=1960308 RepID=A0ABW4P8W5_9NOCA